MENADFCDDINFEKSKKVSENIPEGGKILDFFFCEKFMISLD
jgi:hypothetical protein